MLPESPLLQVASGRIAAAIRRIESAIWKDIRSLEGVSWTGASSHYRSFEEAVRLPRKAVRKGFPWGRLFDQAWFHAPVPQEDGCAWWIVWRDQGEATLYVDGEPAAGLDGPHPRARLRKGTREVWIEAVCLENTVWKPGLQPVIDKSGVPFHDIQICRRDDEAWGAYHDFKVLFDVLGNQHRRSMPRDAQFPNVIGYQPPVERVPVLYRRLMRELDEACSIYERHGLGPLRERLAGIYRSLPARAESLRAVLTGHAHIDLVWLWPERTAEFKAVHSFSTALSLMEDYPEFRFGYSQPASYEAAERCAPGILKRVREAVGRGQWDATGGAYVESDTLLPCGEALFRSILLGQRGFERIRGERSRLMWLPDVFGYSGCLPQILAGCGVPYFFTTKLHWSAVTVFPHSSFRWKGNDGTEVLAHLTQGFGYNGTVDVGELVRGEEEYRQSDVHDGFLAPTGLGDGGGGPTAEDAERARRLANISSVPRVRWGNLEAFFDELARVGSRLPVYQGELYLEYHRGTYTTHGDIKSLYRALERALQTWEAAHVVVRKGEVPERPWQRLVFAQFHDYLPGSSIHEVYQAARKEMSESIKSATASARAALTGKGRRPCLFNPLPLPVIVREGGATALLGPLRGGPFAAFERVDCEPVSVSSRRLSNGLVDARFDRIGRIVSLTVDHRPVRMAAPLGDLACYPDNPGMFEAWDIDRGTLSNGKVESRKPEERTLEQGGAEGALEFSRPLAENSHVRTRYSLRAGEPFLRLTYEIDWREERTLLKALFPTAYDGERARFGAPFGSVLRPQRGGMPEAEAKWEVPGSRYAMTLDDAGTEGFFLVTESKYGWSARDGNLLPSLLRSALVTNSDFHPALRENLPAKPFSDLGLHSIRMAMGLFHADLPRERLPASLAESAFHEPLHYCGEPVSSGFDGLVGDESLVPIWAKPAADGNGWILRLHETLGRPGIARIRLAPGWQASRCGLMEERADGSGDAVSFRPYEIVSIRLSNPTSESIPKKPKRKTHAG